MEAAAPLIRPGENVWLEADVDRCAWAIDGAAYYRAFRETALAAEQTLYILGWDVDSRLELIRGGPPADGLPTALGPFLDAVLRRRPGLHIYLLSWDFALIYAFEREWLPYYRWRWRRRPRLHFHLDDAHPLGGSQHQKIVVADDRVALVGGFDLSHWRWDTPEHRAHDPRRRDPRGHPYPPFHDAAMAVEGEAAAHLGTLARQRWLDATGDLPRTPQRAPSVAPWPESLAPAIGAARVAIARTLPAWGRRPAVREVEALYRDSIAAARQTIYLENQYFTSTAITRALARRLAEPDGPAVILILPLRTGGWLEQHTMDVLRDRQLEALAAADHHGRLRIFYPDAPGLEENPISVHAKIAIIDDRLARIGSANTSNRSMGLDSECDLALPGRDAETSAAVAGLRHRLLAEHLGTTPEAVAAAETERGGTLAALEALNTGERCLRPLPFPGARDTLDPDAELIDPDGPLDPARLASEVAPMAPSRMLRRLDRRLQVALGSLLVALAAYLLSGDRPWLTAALTPSPNLAELGYLVLGLGTAGLVGLPVWAVTAALVVATGPLAGGALAWLLTQAVAALGFEGGRRLGRRGVHRLLGHRVTAIARRLGRHGSATVAALRLVPTAPFALVNPAAGAGGISRPAYYAGTALGSVPGIAASVLLTEGLRALLLGPGLLTAGLFAGALALIASLRLTLHHRLGEG
ncbi:MAG: phospholipase D-like domain-containing protein [Thiohalospira sp.]